MIEGEDYEVVDECIEEEDSFRLKNNSVDKRTDSSDKITVNVMENKEQIEANTDKICIQEEKQSNPPYDETKNEYTVPMKNIYTQPKNENVIDFTMDISLDQLDNQKYMNDEDVMDHLDEIENIVLDSSTFQDRDVKEPDEPDVQILSVKEKNVSEEICIIDEGVPSENNTLSKDDVKIEEVKMEDKWYKEKLAEKEATVKERMSKLARVLEFSYPSYQKWLEVAGKINRFPICKLEPARRCPLDKPHTNRWKFICSRKSVQEGSKEADSADTSLNKSVQTMWQLEPTGAWGVNTNNVSEFPPFVLRAVKIFEDFLQTAEQTEEVQTTNENSCDDVATDASQKKDTSIEGKQQWLWLLVRCNSMDELMLFATGKNISRGTMVSLKQVYESGPGKNCNVKSLYCKSVNKCVDTTVTTTTFLVGSEALDEIVGGIKVQLAPKTNFWSNATGAENVAKTVTDLLSPTPKITVLEIGCGIGLIGLLMASKCRHVIGVDSQSEIEEAEMTCELNNVKNASFIVGSPSEVTSKIVAAIKNFKAAAIINANTNIGRAIEVMTCLRRINSLRRLVMITTLTKQSVRAILELARPADRNIGNPFMPLKACVVDTLPVGPHFEVVILMERRVMHKNAQPWLPRPSEEKKNVQSNTTEENVAGSSIDSSKKLISGKEQQMKKNMDKGIVNPINKKAKVMLLKKGPPLKKIETLSIKKKFKGKRAHSPDGNEIPAKKFIKKFDKFSKFKPFKSDSMFKKKKERLDENPLLRINPLYEKKRDYKDQVDLRERLSSNRIDSDIVQKVKEHQAILGVAKEKLSGSAPTVDVATAKELQNMLNMVLEQTNKLQNQLPRSVWDRIAPPENTEYSLNRQGPQEDPLLKGRYVQEMGAQDILITTANKKFMANEEIKPIYKKYNNNPSVDPNLVMPMALPDTNIQDKSFQKLLPNRYHGPDFRKQQNQGNNWNRDKTFEKNRWNEPTDNSRKPISPVRRHISPIRHRVSPPRRFSPKRPLLSPPRRPLSPPRRHMSPMRRPISPFRPPRNSLMKRQLSPQKRQFSPLRRPMSPTRRQMTSLMHPMSPRRQSSPSRSQISPTRMPISPLRRPISPIRRLMSPPRRHMSPPGRMISPRREMLPARHQLMSQERQHISPIRRGESPTRMISGRPMSPSRRQQSPLGHQQTSPPRRFADEWDIPSRGAIEQSTWRPGSRVPEKSWREERQCLSKPNWDSSLNNDRFRKSGNQDKWDITNSSQAKLWGNNGNGGGDTWNTKQPSIKPNLKEPWSQSSEGRWPGSNPGPTGDNWNIRGKESFGGRDEPWNDNKGRWELAQSKDSWNQPGDKEDWNDLPEDARDPWGDDNNINLKERWQKFDNPGPSSGWSREHEKYSEKSDMWPKQKDNWQNKGPSIGPKSQWQNSNSQNLGETRWINQNDMTKKLQPSGWQSGHTLGSSWPSQQQTFSFQSRSFNTNQFKDCR